MADIQIRYSRENDKRVERSMAYHLMLGDRYVTNVCDEDIGISPKREFAMVFATLPEAEAFRDEVFDETGISFEVFCSVKTVVTEPVNETIGVS